MAHNAFVMQHQDENLRKKGAFRVQDAKRPFIRSYQPRYGDEVHENGNVARGLVTDAQGNTYKTRHVLAVPSGSANASHTEQMRGGNAIMEREQAAILEPYKKIISDFLGDLGKFEHEVATYMKELGMEPLMTQGLSDRKSLRILGFAVHGNARGSGKQLVTMPHSPAAHVPAAAAGPRRDPVAAAAALAAPVRRRIAGKQVSQ